MDAINVQKEAPLEGNQGCEESRKKKAAYNESNDTVIQSIRDIHNRLSKFSGDTNSTSDFADKLYNVLIDCKDTILGSDHDYHNLSVEFSRKNCPLYALSVAKLGAQQYQFSTTLLADIILYGQQACAFDDCNKALERLCQIPYKYWEWRSFVFSIDYLKDSLSWVESVDIYERNLAQAFELIEKLKNNIPFEERAFVAEAEIYILSSDTLKAAEVLEQAIASIQVAPQCCMKLADIYLELGKYKDTIRIAAIGIRATAQEQPSTSIPYFYYLSALAKDALIHKYALEHENDKNGFGNEDIIRDALIDYQIAHELFSTQRRHEEFIQTIQMRRRILEIKAGFVENQADISGEDKFQLLKMLTSLTESKED